MIEAVIWLAIGICLGWTASRMSDAERAAEAWGKHLQDWDGSDEEIVFRADPYDWQNETSTKPHRDVRVRGRHPWSR